MKYVIFDLDGCISDDRWRRDLLPTHDDVLCHDFDKYHRVGYRDEPINREALDSHIELDSRIVFVTARPCRFEAKTRSWLAAHFGAFEYELLMRPDGDLRHSPELKVALIEDATIPWEQIGAAFDDRRDILMAYEAKGLLSVHLLEPPVDLAAVIANRQPSHHAVEEIPGQGGVPDIFREMATTFKERNKVYKNNYKVCAEILTALFPEGVPPEIAHSDAFGLMYMIIGKLTRFTASGCGHVDSVHDIAVYAALIEANLTGRD